ncbi:MAG TPA: nuclear transport factor 2 family protein [Gaiellaceae bacterium]|nr:nuclear transport factor 2 family protein [Gaiellaceae bacterium]
MFSSADVGGMDQLLTRGEGALVIGTDTDEWEVGRETWLDAFRQQMAQTQGVKLEPDDPVAYEEGSLGWGADRPTVVLGDARIPTRLSAVARREDREWRLVHVHLSLPAPDEEHFE